LINITVDTKKTYYDDKRKENFTDDNTN